MSAVFKIDNQKFQPDRLDHNAWACGGRGVGASPGRDTGCSSWKRHQLLVAVPILMNWGGKNVSPEVKKIPLSTGGCRWGKLEAGIYWRRRVATTLSAPYRSDGVLAISRQAKLLSPWNFRGSSPSQLVFQNFLGACAKLGDSEYTRIIQSLTGLAGPEP